MNYTEKFFELRNQFDGKAVETTGDQDSIRIIQHPFTSEFGLVQPNERQEVECDAHRMIIQSDAAIEENRVFSFPVVLPQSSSRFSRAIILLHGLNERSWHKYLPWAYSLAHSTNRPVILFPISFHMNRSPKEWGDPRAMISLLKQRQSGVEPEMASFANVALSLRLWEHPLRFFTSGRQSAEDIVSLIRQIRGGGVSFLSADTQVNFFAYSIGAFLSQILFLANPYNLMSDSKLFIFGGGSLFSHMQGTSKLIMDSLAFRSLRRYYLIDFPKGARPKSPFASYFASNPLGNAFRAMIAPSSLKMFREAMMQRISGQVRVMALSRDRVIPAGAVESTFACVSKRLEGLVEVIDFPYDYTHELPFPIYNNPNYQLVDQSFNRVFGAAADFLR